MIRESSVTLHSRFHLEETMLQIPLPTPTCTRVQTSIEMPCINCGIQMLLALIESRDPHYDVLTYRCVACDVSEYFLSRSKS
jgi:hypothetical protein